VTVQANDEGEAMALLRDEDVAQLREMFESGLTSDVTLVHYTQAPSRLVVPGALQCPSCKDTQDLLGELAETSPHIKLEIHDMAGELQAAEEAGVDKIPATMITGSGASGRVRIFGLPAGYEFGTLVEDIIDVGSGDNELSDASRQVLDGLTEDVHIQVFVTPT
jgi:alkyl hydroperoxide reductase subunit AhpF